MGHLNRNQLLFLKKSKSLKTKFKAMQAVNFKSSNINQVLNESEKTSANDLKLTSQVILLRSGTSNIEEAFNLTLWSVKAKPNSRRVVVNSFIKSKQSSFLVHQMARLKRADAATIMKDYFREGGDMKDVAEWLRTAGSVLKTGIVPDDTDGAWDWVKKKGGAIKDAVVGAINTVADAVKAAGKNLTNAISEVVKWSQSKINDFVEAIITAGHSVGTILAKAMKIGTSALNKFIRAIIEAGRIGREVLNWAVKQSVSILKLALKVLGFIYGSFTSLLIEIAKMPLIRLSPIVKALFALGKKVKDFIIRLDRLAYNIAKNIIIVIRKIGKSVKEIVLALINKSRYIARIVLDALISLNISIASMLKIAINWHVSRLAILIGALKDLQISLSLILAAITKFVRAQAIILMKALRIIWKQVKTILQFIAQKTENTIKTLLVALLGTGIHIRNVLKSVLSELRAAFREGLIKGLTQIGYSALKLMKEVVKISVSAAAVLFAILMDILGTHRGLNAEERAEAAKIFGNSINLNMVKLTDASFAADFIMWMNKNRPFTTMYVINYKSGTTLKMHTLIHELTHIWQAVNSGGVYMLEALHSQFFGKAYNLTNNDLRNANGKIENLEREQQAVLVEEYWKAEFDNQPIGLSLDLIRPLAKQVFRVKGRFVPIQTMGLNISGSFFNPAVITGS